jgi:purine-binding chemotaxis protein CheW
VEATGSTRIVIVEVGNKIIGILVDSVSEVLRISSSVIEPPPDIVSNVESEYIRAVAKLEDRLVILLDLQKIMLNLELQKRGDLQTVVA